MSGELFYTAKIADITYITILYFVFGFYIAKTVNTICDYIFGIDFINLSNFQLGFQIIFQIVFSIFVSNFIKKEIIDRIPFPLEGLGGFTHYKLKEFTENGGIVWGIGILLYEKSLKEKIIILKNKF